MRSLCRLAASAGLALVALSGGAVRSQEASIPVPVGQQAELDAALELFEGGQVDAARNAAEELLFNNDLDFRVENGVLELLERIDTGPIPGAALAPPPDPVPAPGAGAASPPEPMPTPGVAPASPPEPVPTPVVVPASPPEPVPTPVVVATSPPEPVPTPVVVATPSPDPVPTPVVVALREPEEPAGRGGDLAPEALELLEALEASADDPPVLPPPPPRPVAPPAPPKPRSAPRFPSARFEVVWAPPGSGFGAGQAGRLHFDRPAVSFVPEGSRRTAWSVPWSRVEDLTATQGLWDSRHPLALEQTGEAPLYLTVVGDDGLFVAPDRLLEAFARARDAVGGRPSR